ncbi:hypothetical protein BOVA172_576 [Bacteroides ovatus]|nr:hypothetical protein BOVA172_576 [Bacteroides ovatus]
MLQQLDTQTKYYPAMSLFDYQYSHYIAILQQKYIFPKQKA